MTLSAICLICLVWSPARGHSQTWPLIYHQLILVEIWIYLLSPFNYIIKEIVCKLTLLVVNFKSSKWQGQSKICRKNFSYLEPPLHQLTMGPFKYILWTFNIIEYTYSQITLRSNVLHHHFYLPEVDVQVQNGQGVLDSLVLSILDMGIACWGSMSILDLNIYFR